MGWQVNPNRKIKDEDVAYELRILSKRTDLDNDAINVISHAYARIVELERRIEAIKEGFEGCCTTCEPVGVLNQQLRRTISEMAMDRLAKLDEELGLNEGDHNNRHFRTTDGE